MSLQEIKNLKDQKGFTIVELLIVIVVIGILAAIVIVAFNGVQNQAKATQYKTDAAAIAKLAEAYNADETTSGYPQAANDINNYTTVKLPTNVRAGAPGTAGPTTPSATNSGPSITAGVKTYVIKQCAGAGIVVYYWDPAKNSQQSAVAGTCTP